jgi:hypothetical protein
MRYINYETGLEIDLSGLAESQVEFYLKALEKFRENTSWLAFDAFAFGGLSPLYSGRKSHLEVLKDPLYLALKDMCLQLGVQQGMIRRAQKEEKQPLGARGKTKGGREASEKHNRAEDRHLAPAR